MSRWTPPPNWPPSPSPTWAPYPGWQPEPEWGPAPEGWDFYPKDPRPWLQRHAVLAIVALVVVGLVIAGASGAWNTNTPSSAGSDSGTAKQPPLAVNHDASILASSDGSSDEIAYDSAWTKLTRDCKEQEDGLLREVQFAHGDLQKHGEGETYLGLIRHLNASIPADARPIQCQGVIAAYLVIREG